MVTHLTSDCREGSYQEKLIYIANRQPGRSTSFPNIYARRRNTPITIGELPFGGAVLGGTAQFYLLCDSSASAEVLSDLLGGLV